MKQSSSLAGGTSTLGLVILVLCWGDNLIIQWALENVLIPICHIVNIYYSGIGASKVVQIEKSLVSDRIEKKLRNK